MMMRVTALLALFFGTTSAHAWELCAVGAVDLSSATMSTVSQPAFGAGLSVGIPVHRLVNLEGGAFFMPRSYRVVSPGYVGPVSFSNYVEFPILVRLTFFPMLSLGLGGYDAVGFSGAANDLGLIASIAAKFPIPGPFNLLVDVRYLLGLTNTSPTAGNAVYFRDAEMMAGLSMSIGAPK
ncbi:MAG: hypothetical protein ACXVCH_10650 [Bdellovibrionota bacterium]